MTIREEVFQMLEEITPNVFKNYPDNDEDFPCLIFSLGIVGNSDHDGIAYFGCTLTVEIYAEESEEYSDLEMRLILDLIDRGWIHKSNQALTHPDYYHHSLVFETIR